MLLILKQLGHANKEITLDNMDISNSLNPEVNKLSVLPSVSISITLVVEIVDTGTFSVSLLLSNAAVACRSERLSFAQPQQRQQQQLQLLVGASCLYLDFFSLSTINLSTSLLHTTS